MKTNSIIRFFYIVLLCIVSQTIFSQTVWDTLPWKNYADFRLQNLDKSYINTGVLYDRVFPIAQLDERTGLLPNEDTTSSDHFKQSYYEIYNSIYNPSGIYTPDDLENTLSTYPVYNGHPIGIMYYKFNSLDTNALQDNLVDTLANGQFVDVPNRSRTPYFTNTTFVASPLIADDEVFEKGEHTFFLDPAFFLHNDSLHITQVRIDFGDGQGEWIVNNPFDGSGFRSLSTLSSITKTIVGTLIGRIIVIGLDLLGNYIQYGNPFQIKVPGGKGPNDYAPLTTCKGGGVKWVIEAPQSRLDPINAIYGNPQLDYTRKIKDVNGNKITVPVKDTAYFYFADNGSSCDTNVVHKPIVFIDGFDPTNSRGVQQIFEDYIDKRVRRNGVDTAFGKYMLNQGYDFIILDYKHGNDLMERNAMTVVSLLERLYQRYGTTFQQDITIIGPSMGSAIAQYALAYMEHNNIPTHVKTYISFDGAHQGANVPIGLQNMVEYLTKRGLLSKLNAVKSNIRNGLYNGLAARQLLAHHTSASAEFPTPDALRNQFLINLQGVGEYPLLCRKVALINGVSNGVLNQDHQTANESLLHIINKRKGWKSIWGLCNGNICKNVDWECKSAPNVGREKVTDMWTLDPIINLIFWVPPFETNKYATAAWGNSSQDNAPGSRFGPVFGTQGGDIDQNKFTFLLKEFFYLLTGSKRTTFSQNINDFTFTPSYASADLRFPSLTDNSNKNLYMDWSNTYLCNHTPFDYIYAPKDINGEHVFVSQQGSEWFESEVRCARADLPVFVNPNMNGSSNLCSAENYSISFCQTGNHNVTWTLSNPNLVTISGSGDLITLTANGSGSLTLTATITFACAYSAPIVITKQIIVGTQTPTFIPYGTICASEPFTLCANPIANALSRQWVARVGSSNVVLQETSSWCVEVPANTLYVDLFVTNNCGTAQKRQFIRYTDCGSFASFSISPNPSSTTTTVTALRGSSFTEIKIIDKSGNVRKQFKFAKETKNASIDINELTTDIYTIQAFDGKKWTSIKFSKQ